MADLGKTEQVQQALRTLRDIIATEPGAAAWGPAGLSSSYKAMFPIHQIQHVLGRAQVIDRTVRRIVLHERLVCRPRVRVGIMPRWGNLWVTASVSERSW
jgi:hypothetical protein